MALDLTSIGSQPAPAVPRVSRRVRRQERQRLSRQDRESARLADLHQIEGLVAQARAVVCGGWVQNGWFVYRDQHGQERTATPHDVRQMAGRPVLGACLVGAIVHAGGGLPAVRSQPVQRALDLTWHTLYRSGRQPVQWCPAPTVRAAHLRDLTRWNDEPGRTDHDVTALLGAVERAAASQVAQCTTVGDPRPCDAASVSASRSRWRA